MNKKIIVLMILLSSTLLIAEGKWKQFDKSGVGGKIVFDSVNTMFFAFREQETHPNYDGPYFASVKKYDVTSKKWVYVGQPQFSPELIDARQEYSPLSFVVSNNRLFVAFVTGGSQSERKMMIYNETSSQWDYLSENIPQGSNYTILTSDKDSKLYLAFRSTDGIKVVYSNEDATKWYRLTDPVVTYGDAPFDFKVDSHGVPFLSYIQYSQESPGTSVAIVSYYDTANNIWKILGNTGFTGIRKEDSPNVPQLTVNSKSNIYVKFITEDYKSIKIMKYDETSKAWTMFLEHEYEEMKSNVNISFDRKGTLFASFVTTENGELKTDVMKYITSSLSWDIIGEDIAESCGPPLFDNENRLFVSCSNLGIMKFYDDMSDSANTSADTDNTTDSGDSVDDTSGSDGGNACAAVVIW